MNLYFVRHGESEGNKLMKLYGHTDYPLTDKGRLQAEEVYEKLKHEDIKVCYSSPLIRASETAKIAVGDRDIPMVFMDGLREQFMGDYEDVSFFGMLEEFPETIKPMIADWTKVRPPMGESYFEMLARASKCMEEIIAKGEDAMIVAHNGTLATILAYLLEGGAIVVGKLWFGQGVYTKVSIGEHGVKLECFNR